VSVSCSNASVQKAIQQMLDIYVPDLRGKVRVMFLLKSDTCCQNSENISSGFSRLHLEIGRLERKLMMSGKD
jgi:hypothetical protein